MISSRGKSKVWNLVRRRMFILHQHSFCLLWMATKVHAVCSLKHLLVQTHHTSYHQHYQHSPHLYDPMFECEECMPAKIQLQNSKNGYDRLTLTTSKWPFYKKRIMMLRHSHVKSQGLIFRRTIRVSKIESKHVYGRHCHLLLHSQSYCTYIAELQRFKGLEYMLFFAVHTANSCARPNKNNEVKYWFAKPYLFCHLFIFPLPHWNLNASINHAKIQHIDLDIPIAIYSCRLVLNSSCCP